MIIVTEQRPCIGPSPHYIRTASKLQPIDDPSPKPCHIAWLINPNTMSAADTAQSSVRIRLSSTEKTCERHNARISRLHITHFPTNLLRRVFSCFPPFFTEEAREACESKYTPHGFNVCRRWRTIVREMPHFWTVIPLKDPFWADVALMYSRHASICIDVELDRAIEQPAYFQTVQRALQHAHRARRLTFRLFPEGDQRCEEIDDPSGILKRIVRILTTLQAPLLEEFYFTDNPDCKQDLPFDLFCGQPLPRLCSLELENCNVRHDSNLLSASLSILGLMNTGITWPVESWLVFGNALDYARILSNHPNLQTLKLEHPRYGNARCGVGRHAQISLPCLERMHITDYVSAVADFTQFLSLPDGVKRVFTCVDKLKYSLDQDALEEWEIEDSRAIDSLTSAFLHHFTPATQIDAVVSFICLDLVYGPSLNRFVLSAAPSQQWASDFAHPNPITFELCAPPEREGFMAHMFSAIPSCFQGVRVLKMTDGHCFAAPQSTQRLRFIWPLLNRLLPHVAEIQVQGPVALGFVACVASRYFDEQFGELRTLILQMVDFSSDLDLEPVFAYYNSYVLEPTLFESLLCWLFRRREAGVLIKLTIDCCDLTQEMQQQLQQVALVDRRDQALVS
ncbi:hypothetical protein BV25DRAFT_1320806 [Artomyces pyxidatus]|uniref:Uncharacterized protein n=1 Tax=Artomyces pyxidatus TaxID=48021 RepID=A0ACB8SNY1_9AGAM|nr:hypothetical protein BV25DRAFT_1320806 [Artomyces pyxidatus]